METRMLTAIAKGNDSKAVATQLVKGIKDQLQSEKIGMALLYISSTFDYQTLLKTVRSELLKLGDAPLIGCTSSGEFTEKEVLKHSAALSVLTASDSYEFHVAIDAGLHEDPEGCVRRVISALPPMSPAFSHRAVILLHDGLAGRGEEAVLSASMVLGPKVSLAGGSAGDDLAFKQTFVFCNDQVLTNSVAMCTIDSKTAVGIGVKHGHSPVTEPLTVTRAVDNVLFTVDGKPAWDVWKEKLATEAKSIGIDVNHLTETSEIGQFLIRYEMGLATAGTEFKVRVPLSKNADGSLNFACTIPEGAKFRIMKSPKNDQITSAAAAGKLAMQQMKGKTLIGAFIFDCVCRGIILGDDFEKGIAAIKGEIGKIPLIGFETYGEICRQSGQFSGYHNTTTVVMLLAK